MQMQILKYVHIKIRKGSKEKSSDHSWEETPFFIVKFGRAIISETGLY